MTNDPFRFTVDRVRSQFAKAELIESLKAYSRLRDAATFAMRDYDAWPGRVSTSDTISRYFGSWGKALQAAELRTSRGHKLDPKAMVTAFKDCWRKHGSVPSVNQLEAFLETGGFPFRYKSYLNFFG
jgi:hypothetical protein